MNQSVIIKFEVVKNAENGKPRVYDFTVPYGSPYEETLSAIIDIKTFFEIRCAELKNAQQQRTQPTGQETTCFDAEEEKKARDNEIN